MRFAEKLSRPIELFAEHYLRDAARVRGHGGVLVDDFESAFVQCVALIWPRRVSVELASWANGLHSSGLSVIHVDLEASAVLSLDHVVALTLKEGVVAVSLTGPVIDEEALDGPLLIAQSLYSYLGTGRDIRTVIGLARLGLILLLLRCFLP